MMPSIPDNPKVVERICHQEQRNLATKGMCHQGNVSPREFVAKGICGQGKLWPRETVAKREFAANDLCIVFKIAGSIFD